MWENQILNFLMDFISIKTFIAIIVIYFLIVWIAVIVWVVKDISNRTQSILLQIISVLIVIIFWPLWVLIYLLIRPNRTFFEKYYEEVEWNIDYLTNAIFKKLEEKEKIKEEDISKIKDIEKKDKKIKIKKTSKKKVQKKSK